ncbi:hypothetical protein ACIXJN_05055 [Bacteroides fragilis]
MKKHILYALLLCGICQGCGSSSQVHRKTEVKSISDSLLEGSGIFTHRENEIHTDSNRKNRLEKQERVVLLFDTDKPVSPQTGLPPVREISFSKALVREESQNGRAAYRVESSRADSSLSVRTHKEEEDKKDLESRKKTNPVSLLQGLVSALGALAGICLPLTFLRTRFFSKTKALCRRIFKG